MPTIKDICDSFRTRELPYLQSINRGFKFEKLMALLEDQFADMDSSKFGPLKLQDLRDELNAKNLSRSYLNELTGMLIRIFRHGVSRELYPPDKLVALESVKPLRRDECKPDKPKTKTSLEQVLEAIKVMPKPIDDMLMLQVLTGARPSELFTLKASEVERREDLYLIHKENHKTQHRGKQRTLIAVGQAKQILESHIDDLPFTNRNGNPWNKDTYRRAIQRRLEKHNLKRFTPYSIRHLSAQTVRDEGSAEDVASLLGHSSLSLVNTYSDQSIERAIGAARMIEQKLKESS